MAARLHSSRRAGGFLPRPLLSSALYSDPRGMYGATADISAPKLPEPSPDPFLKHLPEHLHPPHNPLLHYVFKWICLVSLGAPNLTGVWCDVHNLRTFEISQELVKDRVTNVTVVAGLILSATAALVTTVPPRPDIVNYNIYGPYILLLLSLTVSLGGLIVGSAAVYFLSSRVDVIWFKDHIMSSRLKVTCSLIVIGYPFWSIGVSTVLTALGLLTAAFYSSHSLVRIGGAFVLAVPAFCAPVVFYIIHAPGSAAQTQNSSWSQGSTTADPGDMLDYRPYPQMSAIARTGDGAPELNEGAYNDRESMPAAGVGQTLPREVWDT